MLVFFIGAVSVTDGVAVNIGIPVTGVAADAIIVVVRWKKNSVPMAWYSMITIRMSKNAIYHTTSTVHNDLNYVSAI